MDLRWIVAALALSGVAGCGVSALVRDPDGSTHWRTVEGAAAVAVTRAAREIPCGRSLTLEEVRGDVLRVRGCGVTRTYLCRDRSCEAHEPQPAPQVQTAATTWADADVHALVARVHDRMVACLPVGTDEARIPVTIGADGATRRTGAAALPAVLAEDVTACIDAILEGDRMGREASSARSVTLQLRRSAVGLGAQPATPVSEADPAPAP